MFRLHTIQTPIRVPPSAFHSGFNDDLHATVCNTLESKYISDVGYVLYVCSIVSAECGLCATDGNVTCNVSCQVVAIRPAIGQVVQIHVTQVLDNTIEGHIGPVCLTLGTTTEHAKVTVGTYIHARITSVRYSKNSIVCSGEMAPKKG